MLTVMYFFWDGFGVAENIVAGPYKVAALQAHEPGSVAQQTHEAGAVARQTING